MKPPYRKEVDGLRALAVMPIFYEINLDNRRLLTIFRTQDASIR
jgi:hypothetical protein